MILADATTDTLGFAGRLGTDVGINSAWVMLAAVLVMFMQAGFAMLEIGFVRGKNAGSVVAKILVNFALAALGFWAIGFALAFGGTDALIGTNGFFVAHASDFPLAFPANQHGVTAEVLWFFQFVFCAVALAIVWGTTLERIKFGVYIIYALVFSTFIYPVVAHWIFGGGWLASRSTSRTSPARSSSTSAPRPPRWRSCCSSGRGAASTAATGARARSRATTCRSSGSA